MNKTKSRPFTLTAAILNTVFAALTILGAIYILVELSSLNYSGQYMLAYAIEMLFAVATLTIAIVLIVKARVPVTKFPRGVAITLFVFNIILSVFGIIGISGMTLAYIIIDLLIVAVYILCSVFIMVDVAKNGKLKQRIANGETYLDSDQEYNEYMKSKSDQAQSQAAKKVEEKPAEQNGALYNKLAELQKMKEAGMINEQEYSKMRAKVLDDYK